MDEIDRRLRRIQAWARWYHAQDPDAPELASSEFSSRACIAGADRPETFPLFLDSSLSANQRLRFDALDPPQRVHGKIALRHPGIVGLLGIEAQEICLPAPHLDDATWANALIC